MLTRLALTRKPDHGIPNLETGNKESARLCVVHFKSLPSRFRDWQSKFGPVVPVRKGTPATK